jgi:putative PIN family toxin of toxin-antitoxin system
MDQRPVVIDTCVIVSALRSRRGAAYRLVREIGAGSFDIALSLSLYLQYQDVSSRLIESTFGTADDVSDFLDFIVKVSKPQVIHYLWRPYLPDADDDMVLELAVASNSQSIVTFNKRDFDGADDFGCRVESPLELLKRLGILP